MSNTNQGTVNANKRMLEYLFHNPDALRKLNPEQLDPMLTDCSSHFDAKNMYEKIRSDRGLLFVAEKALDLKHYTIAMDIFINLDMKGKIRQTAELAHFNHYISSAARGYSHLEDDESLLRLMDELLISKEGAKFENNILLDYYKKGKFAKSIERSFAEWTQKKGFKDAPIFLDADCITMARSVANRYEAGICVAKGGLFLGYLADMFGLDTRVVESHREGIEYKEIDSTGGLQGKNVVVLDKDCITGKTLENVFSGIKGERIRNVDVALVHEEGTSGMTSRIENIPEEYGLIHLPSMYRGQEIIEAINELENRIR